MAKNMIRLGIILMLFSAIAALALAVTNNVTADKILEQIALAEQEALKQAAPAATEFTALTDKVGQFSGRPELGDVQNIWEAKAADGTTAGYVVRVAPVGYGDRIITLVGVGNDGAITGLVIIAADNETPGLGAKVKQPEFQAQYTGKGASGELVVVKRAASADNEVQAITAATISSTAVTKGANEALTVWKELTGR
ncbi:MAG: RnfABCDGE type electron transport complex subunit G [Chloroflexota bacterium]